MKIAPISDILIAGVHSPAGVAVEVADAAGKMLVASGLAVLVKELAQPSPIIETATASAAPENAALPHTARKRR